MKVKLNLSNFNNDFQSDSEISSLNSISDSLIPIGKSGIHIKKENRGKFTEYCGGKVTDACIRRAKASGNPKLVKRATFAANARKWKHQQGGLIRKMQTAAGGPLRIKFTPEQIAQFESYTTRVPGMNNSGGNRYREEGVQAQQHQEQEAKRKEEEIKSRSERPHVLKRKVTPIEKLQGKKDEYEQTSQVVGMSGADPIGEFVLAGIGLNGVGALAKTGLWNVAKYAPKTWLGNQGRKYFVDKAFKGSFNGTVPVLTQVAPKNIVKTESNKQKRVISEGTYPMYRGKQHSVKEVVNSDGTVNPRQAMKIQHEVSEQFPGSYKMEHRLENPEWHQNDPTTYHHTKNVAQSAWKLPTPEGYTKQDQMIAALGHDFGKIISGDGHEQIGADLVEQAFIDIKPYQLQAIREHMGQPTTRLGEVTQAADMLNGRDFSYLQQTSPELYNKIFRNKK